jgi:hypothetical protein
VHHSDRGIQYASGDYTGYCGLWICEVAINPGAMPASCEKKKATRFGYRSNELPGFANRPLQIMLLRYDPAASSVFAVVGGRGRTRGNVADSPKSAGWGRAVNGVPRTGDMNAQKASGQERF